MHQQLAELVRVLGVPAVLGQPFGEVEEVLGVPRDHVRLAHEPPPLPTEPRNAVTPPVQADEPTGELRQRHEELRALPGLVGQFAHFPGHAVPAPGAQRGLDRAFELHLLRREFHAGEVVGQFVVVEPLERVPAELPTAQLHLQRVQQRQHGVGGASPRPPG
ncbi:MULTISPECIES: hypothetical protein [Saccharothrix]|uniref:hypothetical protein n=1 Tax=Saccharothrix TaxID=2071 RepID=UPI001161112B|nr:hypothetical protein [Saccharothrix sp. CB00851]